MIWLRYREGGVGYVEVKNELLERIWSYFTPYRERHEELSGNRKHVRKILAEGAEKARYHAINTLRKVRKKTGVIYIK